MPATSEIAAAWRREALSPFEWKDCPNQAGAAPGEAGGCFVQAAGFSRRAYLKPIFDHPDEPAVCRAAREKIAADLAFDLGLPVPPVQLCIRRGGRARIPAAVSLVMYPRQWAWEQIRHLPLTDPDIGSSLASVLATATPMLAFDTWLELRAVDASGRVIFWSGAVADDGKGPVEEGAHFCRAYLLDAHGNHINKRNAWSARSALTSNGAGG